MYQYPAVLEEFIEDEDERQYLRASYADPDRQDPFHNTIDQLATQVATLARAIPPGHRKAIELYHQGRTKAEITRQTRITHATITKALHSPKGLQLMSLLEQIQQLRKGPSLEARRAMLWRIALRAEQHKPSVALSAIDTLEKQAGTYRPHDDHSNEGTIIKIARFEVNNNQITLKDITPVTDNTLPGEFTAIKVDTE